MTDMKRLTTDDTESILFGLNLFFAKDNEVWIRGGGPDPDYQDCTLTDWINRAAAAQGIELDAKDAESLVCNTALTLRRGSWHCCMRPLSRRRKCVDG